MKIDRLTILYLAVTLLLMLVVRVMLKIEGFEAPRKIQRVATPQWVLDKKRKQS